MHCFLRKPPDIPGNVCLTVSSIISGLSRSCWTGVVKFKLGHYRAGGLQVAHPEVSRDAFGVISERAVAFGIGQVEAEEVDRLNVYWAAMEAWRRAVDALPTLAAHILVDGKRRIAGCRLPQAAVIAGDALSASIAAASIVAKVTHDALMRRYAQIHPEYCFDRHKGYATANDLSALRRFGPLPLHRHSYAPVWIATGLQLRLALGDDGAQGRVTWQDSVQAAKIFVWIASPKYPRPRP
jgi:ribonuclease HII